MKTNTSIPPRLCVSAVILLAASLCAAEVRLVCNANPTVEQVTHYGFWERTDGTNWTLIGTTPDATNGVRFQRPFGKYTWSATAFNSAGMSEYATPLEFELRDDSVTLKRPSAPVMLAAVIAPDILFPPGAGNFHPTNVDGMALWLDASDAGTLYDATSGGSLVSADGAVARWEDKSGNARHATNATSGYRAIRKTSIQNSKDVLRFDGTDDHFFVSDFYGSNITMFAVIRLGSLTGTRHLLRKGFESGISYEYLQRAVTGTNLFGINNGSTGANAVGGAFATNTFALTSGSYDGTNVVASFNQGAPISTAISGAIQNYSYRLRIGSSYTSGSDTSNPADTWIGDIAELMLFTNKVSAANITAIEDWLQSKWETP